MKRENLSVLMLSVVLSLTMGLYASCSQSSSPAEDTALLVSKGMAVETQDAEAALSLYEQVLMSESARRDPILLRNAHLRIGLLFLRYGLAEESLGEFRQVFSIDSLRRDTIALDYDLRYMAMAYECQGFFAKAKDVAKLVAADTLRSQRTRCSFAYQSMSKDLNWRYERLLAHLECLPDSLRWATHRLTPNSSELQLAVEAWYAETQGDLSLAERYYEELSTEVSVSMKAFSLLRLMNLRLQQNDLPGAKALLARYQDALANMRKDEQTAKRLLQQHARYQEQLSRKEIGRLHHVNWRQLQVLVVVTTISLLVVAVLLLVVRLYRQQRVILRFKVERLRQWREEWLAKGQTERRQVAVEVSRTDVSTRISHKLNGADGSPMTDQDWNDLETEILRFFPHFKERLFALCRLSAHDYHVCLLLKLGVKPSGIARLTFHSDEAISSSRRRLYFRATGQKGAPADWDGLIDAL